MPGYCDINHRKELITKENEKLLSLVLYICFKMTHGLFFFFFVPTGRGFE